MKITPIKNSSSIYKHNAYYKNTSCRLINADNNFYSQTFKGSCDSELTAEISNIENSDKFKDEMKALKSSALSKEVSFDDFLASAMRLTNKYCGSYPIKEDFFKYKAKKRFTEIIKTCLNNEFNGLNDFKTINEYITEKYQWGLNDKKYGSSCAYTVAVMCILPYAKNYEIELQLSKLEHLASRENSYRKTLQDQERGLRNKELISETYFKPLITLKSDPSVSLPNAIMIEGKNPKDNEELIGWTLSKTPGNKMVIENDASVDNTMIKNKLKSALDKSKQVFENYKTPTLIYCEEFDKLINSSNSAIEIAAMKSLLSSIYSIYGATIIFSAQNSNEIDNAIKQPHRISIINIDG